ncbi:MAG: class I SAM-dependent methyltransferase [Sedimentisphaerales bacterium]|nr:class I SAM-dependent methyltransferase [Sedimentisphaerales bacterium]
MKQFDSSQQDKFWATQKPPYKGDLVSDVILSLGKRYIGKNAIDIGAGSGALMRSFRGKYKDSKSIVGVDISPKVEYIQQGDCTNLRFEDDSFDTCFATDLIEHLSDPDLDKCLNEINRILKKNGFAIINTIDNENFLKAMVTCPECGCTFHRTGHCQVFDEDRIRELFANKGFSIVTIRKLNLGYVSMFKFFGHLFYLLRLDKLFKVKLLTNDMFFVARKEKDLK